MLIHTSVDFRKDTPDYPKKDPDVHSPKLRRYHKLLWSKPLPGGAHFDLDDTRPRQEAYLYYRSHIGKEFFLASDSVIPTFTRWGFAKAHPELCTEQDNEEFMATSYTIGGMMIFPGNRIHGRWTVNQARGCLKKISDRFDLTIECIHRHYARQHSPLSEALARYDDFFALFESFRGYVDFFLLQDLVTDDYRAVRFFMPFDNFNTSAVPTDIDTYKEYRRLSIESVEARNRRIAEYAGSSNRV